MGFIITALALAAIAYAENKLNKPKRKKQGKRK